LIFHRNSENLRALIDTIDSYFYLQAGFGEFYQGLGDFKRGIEKRREN